MARNKRSAEELDGVHTSREKRIKHAAHDGALAEIYNNLADEVAATRLKAASDLLKHLSEKTPDQLNRLKGAESRLVRGLCSGRKAARLGFSIALTEVLRLAFNPGSGSSRIETQLSTLIGKIVELTEPKGNIGGQERRDYLLGRRYAFQAILYSDVGLDPSLPENEWRVLVEAIFKLASQKQWLRRECGLMLHDYLISEQAANLSDQRVQVIVDELISSKQAKTPEGVGLWITVQRCFEDVSFPKGVWHKRNPLSPKEVGTLSKIMLETSIGDEDKTMKAGSRQATPSFAWTEVFNQLYQQGGETFIRFWNDTVVTSVFSPSASPERQALGLQLSGLVISTAPGHLVRHGLNKHCIACLVDQRATSERYLFEAAKTTLAQIVSRAKRDPELAGTIVTGLLHRPTLNFDQLTKTKAIETLIGLAGNQSLSQIAAWVAKMVHRFADQDSEHELADQRVLADLLLTMVRLHKDTARSLMDPSGGVDWLQIVLCTLVDAGYGSQKQSSASTQSKQVFQSRLTSCLNQLLGPSVEDGVNGPVFVVQYLFKKKFSPSNESAADTLANARTCLDNAFARHTDDLTSRAFSLLLSLSILQVYNEEPDSLAALDDLVTCYRSKNNSDDATTMLIELLLSFVSKPSALFRKLAEQVFAAFAGELTSDSLQSLLDILEQKESLSGQQALFDQNGDDMTSDLGEDNAIDVEDASDVEIVNGLEVNGSDAGDDVHSDDTSDDSSEAEEGAEADEDEEEAAFNKKLADALGTNSVEDGSDEDGSDMDDEQMMALEPHLVSIFKERKNETTKKQEKKGAKENIVNFKNRVLDLLTIYVKSQYSNVLGLDLILPLIRLIRTTSNKATSEKAFAVLKQYFETSNKNKSLPLPDDEERCFEVLAAIHGELRLGGSKLHANACSRSSLFLSKVLVGMDQRHYGQIAEMYAKLQSEWYLDTKSKIQGSVFTEWTSWSIGTRKHN